MRGLIWLTWRQHRWTIVISAALTAILAVLMVMTASGSARWLRTARRAGGAVQRAPIPSRSRRARPT